jgi:hypothetical protein
MEDAPGTQLLFHDPLARAEVVHLNGRSGFGEAARLPASKSPRSRRKPRMPRSRLEALEQVLMDLQDLAKERER